MSALVSETNNVNFSHYGKQFQEKIFQGLLSDHDWASQMFEVMNPGFFELNQEDFCKMTASGRRVTHGKEQRTD